MIRPRGRAALEQLTPWLRAAAITAALISFVILLTLQRIAATSSEDRFLLANRTSMVVGLIATVSAIGALIGGRLSRASKLVMGVAICVGLAALVYGAWLEVLLNALNHACWTGSC